MHQDRFKNRREAGKTLALGLTAYKKSPNAIILALPRGGVPVAYEIAKALMLPLDVFLVRKLGVPQHQELAFGAIATGEAVFLNEPLIQSLQLSKKTIRAVIDKETKELQRRESIYRHHKPAPTLAHKTIILVDDGIATGATTLVAIKALRKQNPEHIVLAVPVAADSTYEKIAPKVDEFVCLLRPKQFNAVGAWFDDFKQISDKKVIFLLENVLKS